MSAASSSSSSAATGRGNDSPRGAIEGKIAAAETEIAEAKAEIAEVKAEVALYKAFPSLEDFDDGADLGEFAPFARGDRARQRNALRLFLDGDQPQQLAGLQQQLAELQGTLKEFQHEKNALRDEKARLEAARAAADAWRVRVVVGDWRRKTRRKVFEVAESTHAFYGTPREEDGAHRGKSIGWRRVEAPREGESRAEAAKAGRPYDLHVNVLFREFVHADDFATALGRWEGSVLDNVHVDVGEPLREVGHVNLDDHEHVRERHYKAGADDGSPSKAESGSTSAVSEVVSISLAADLAQFQGLDTAHMRAGGELVFKAHKCHLIPNAVCKKHYKRGSDDRRTMERYPDNFVAMSAGLHGVFDAWGTDQDEPLFALRYTGPVASARESPTSRGPAATRVPVAVDVIIKSNDKTRDYIFGRLHNPEPREPTVVNGVALPTMRVAMEPLSPDRFKECMDWKFAETLALWVAQDDDAGTAPGRQREAASFSIDTSRFACVPGSAPVEELRRSERLKRQRVV